LFYNLSSVPGIVALFSLNEHQDFMHFEEFGLHPQILKAVQEAGFTSPTPIQAQAIPEIIKGSDLRASAQTGTGKTAAFILPSLNRLSVPSQVQGKGPRVLILVPTRELAMQVAVEAAKYSKHIPRCKTVCIYGGAPYPPQNRDLSRPHEILVATPGRLIDHMEQGRIDFSRVELFILDEADRMLDMGFIGPVELIASKLPASRQTLMFSATLAGNVMKLSNRLLKNPVEVRVAPEKVDHEKIDQRLYRVDSLEHKYRLLDHLLSDPDMTQTIIFTATKRQADSLVEKLANRGRNARALHGGMNQRQRTRTIKEMRQETFDILVATDVAARGIDIQTITHVINFDLPKTSTEDYVHRIGRTGRAGASGVALSFASHKDMSLVRQIEKFTGQRMNPHQVPGMEPKFEQATPRSAQPEARRGARFHKKGQPNQARGKPRRWYP
jgi:superfamily II DNA/RNA helicase